MGLLRSTEKFIIRKSVIYSLTFGGLALAGAGFSKLNEGGLSAMGERVSAGALAIGLLGILASLGAAMRADTLQNREMQESRREELAQLTSNLESLVGPSNPPTATRQGRDERPPFGYSSWTSHPTPSVPIERKKPGITEGTGCLLDRFREFPDGFEADREYGCAARTIGATPATCDHSGTVVSDPSMGKFLRETVDGPQCLQDLGNTIAE